MPGLRDEQRAADGSAGKPSSLDLNTTTTTNKPRPRLSQAVNQTPASLSPFATAAMQSGSAVREGAQSETNRLLSDLAPHILRPRVLQAAAAASASLARTPYDSTVAAALVLGRSTPGFRLTNPVRSLLRFRALVKNGPITASELQLAETSNQILLSAALDENLDWEPSGVAADVSLLRGFQATLPSALEGRTRRRKARGREAPHMGLLAMGNSARGLLTDLPEPHHPAANSTPSTKDIRKVRRANTRKRDIPLGVEELQAQLDEILLDKKNLTVRRVRSVFSLSLSLFSFVSVGHSFVSVGGAVEFNVDPDCACLLALSQRLLSDDVDTITAKIQELEQARKNLQRGLLGLQEEELELNDEQKAVSETLSLQRYHASMPGGGSSSNLLSTAAIPAAEPTLRRSSKRVQVPLFLPSEHDDLPKGVAFMTLSGHMAPITTLDFSEPYGTLVSAAADETVRVWDLTHGDEVGRLRGHSGTYFNF